MPFSTLDLILMALYVIIIMVIGLSLRKTAGKSLQDFFLGGRKMPWYLAGLSMVATTFATDTPLAVTELVGQHGISGNWLWWNFMIGGMLTVFFFARMWQRAGILTELEFTEIRYSGKRAAFLRGFRAIYLGLFLNMLIIGWVSLAYLTIIEVLFDISHAQALLAIAVAMILVGFYSAVSGLWGIVLNDALQFVLAMAGSIVLAIFVLNSPETGGIAGLKEALPDGAFRFFPDLGNASEIGGMVMSLSVGSFIAFIGFQWWASWYPGSEPGGGGYVVQRMMSTPDEKSAFWATFIFQVGHFCIRPWPWILVALAVPVIYPELSDNELRMGYVMAMKDFLPSGWLGLMFVALTAAYMSTVSTQLNWGASYLVNDFGKRFFPTIENRFNWVTVSRFVTLLLLSLAFISTLFFQTITGVWFFIIEASAGLGLVLMLRWYWWRINAWSEITAAIAPLFFSAFFKLQLGMDFPESFFYTLTCTTITWLLATYITSPEPESILTSFYKRVRPGGVWGQIAEKEGKAHFQSNLYLLKLLITWAVALTATYSFLFSAGYWLLHEWHNAVIATSILTFSIVLLTLLFRKFKIGSENETTSK